MLSCASMTESSIFLRGSTMRWPQATDHPSKCLRRHTSDERERALDCGFRTWRFRFRRRELHRRSLWVTDLVHKFAQQEEADVVDRVLLFAERLFEHPDQMQRIDEHV